MVGIGDDLDHRLSPRAPGSDADVQVDACARVARDLVNARRTLSAEEKAVLLTVPPEWLASGRVSEPDPAPLAQTLARVGVDWGD